MPTEAAVAGAITLCAGSAKIGSSSGKATAMVLTFERGTSTSSVLPGCASSTAASVARRGAGTDGGFVPIVGDVGSVLGQIVLDIDFGGRVGVRAVIGFRIDQRKRDFRHASRLAVAGARRR